MIAALQGNTVPVLRHAQDYRDKVAQYSFVMQPQITCIGITKKDQRMTSFFTTSPIFII